MKKLLIISSLAFCVFTAPAQSVSPDSAVSLDSKVTLNVALPVHHGISAVDVFKNNIRIGGFLARDTSSADVVSLLFPYQSPGTATYFVKTRPWLVNPCGSSWRQSNAIQVQVGSQSCCRVNYVALSQNLPKRINVSFGLCAGCSKYSIIFKRLNSSNASIIPNPDVNVLGTGTRLNGYTPTFAEAASNVLNRSYPTDFGNFWYQVDVLCTNCPTASNKVTALIFVTA
jgi:hypothetical protein